ncbi:MAG: hypothetical protein FWB72_06300 [Firmicutes bacterium]|nr:hypothetical protein [Bacillota bacterium]
MRKRKIKGTILTILFCSLLSFFSLGATSVLAGGQNNFIEDRVVRVEAQTVFVNAAGNLQVVVDSNKTLVLGNYTYYVYGEQGYEFVIADLGNCDSGVTLVALFKNVCDSPLLIHTPRQMAGDVIQVQYINQTTNLFYDIFAEVGQDVVDYLLERTSFHRPDISAEDRIRNSMAAKFDFIFDENEFDPIRVEAEDTILLNRSVPTLGLAQYPRVNISRIFSRDSNRFLFIDDPSNFHHNTNPGNNDITHHNDEIVRFIPQSLFTTAGMHYSIGREWGFFIRTHYHSNFSSPQNGRPRHFSSRIFVFAVELNYLSGRSPRNSLYDGDFIRVLPLFQFHYESFVRTPTTRNGEWICSSRRRLDPILDVITIRLEIASSPNFAMTNVSFSFNLANETRPNQFDENYIAFCQHPSHGTTRRLIDDGNFIYTANYFHNGQYRVSANFNANNFFKDVFVYSAGELVLNLLNDLNPTPLPISTIRSFGRILASNKQFAHYRNSFIPQSPNRSHFRSVPIDNYEENNGFVRSVNLFSMERNTNNSIIFTTGRGHYAAGYFGHTKNHGVLTRIVSGISFDLIQGQNRTVVAHIADTNVNIVGGNSQRELYINDNQFRTCPECRIRVNTNRLAFLQRSNAYIDFYFYPRQGGTLVFNTNNRVSVHTQAPHGTTRTQLANGNVEISGLVRDVRHVFRVRPINNYYGAFDLTVQLLPPAPLTNIAVTTINTLDVAQSLAIAVRPVPVNATIENVVWTASVAGRVAFSNVNTNTVLVTGRSVGQVTITATAGGFSQSFVVTITQPRTCNCWEGPIFITWCDCWGNCGCPGCVHCRLLMRTPEEAFESESEPRNCCRPICCKPDTESPINCCAANRNEEYCCDSMCVDLCCKLDIPDKKSTCCG